MISDFFAWSFRRQLETHREGLYKLAWSWCHQADLADDLVQETYIKALKSRSQLQDLDKLKPWLTRILVNTHIDYLRTKRNQIPLEDHHVMDHGDPTIVMDRKDNIQQVRNAIANLNDNHRKVVTLIDLEEFSYSEVAEILSIPVGTVMSRLNRARMKLKESLLDKSRQTPLLRRVK